MVRVEDRKGRDMGSFEVDTEKVTVADFKKVFYGQNKRRIHPTRQWFTFGPDKIKVNDPDKTLASYGVEKDSVLVFKLLPYQISWTTVFLVEYFGPILVHALLYFFGEAVYGQPVATGETRYKQQVMFALVAFHYAKREFETIFIHRFSNGTMPYTNIFKNSFHYWIIGGLMIAYPIYHPLYTNTMPLTTFHALAGLFILMELGNGWAHVVLRNLRPPGTRKRGIPRGGLFELVSCANYTYELGAWLVFSVMSMAATSWIFFAVSFGQIYIWALKKHRMYRKQFDDYPRRRKALVPFIA